MLKLFKRWLGWDSDWDQFDLGDARVDRGPSAPRASPRRPVAPRASAPTPQPAGAQAQPKIAAPKDSQKERDPKEVLDDPRLTLDRPNDDGGFDPYNTGAFNRSTSWERISRHKR